MWRIVGISLWWLFLAAATMIFETVFVAVPLWLMVLIAGGLGCAAVPLMFGRGGRMMRVPCLYVPIRTAIRHVIHTTPHSYQNAQMATDHYFEVLHEQMCSGRIRPNLNSEIGHKRNAFRKTLWFQYPYYESEIVWC